VVAQSHHQKIVKENIKYMRDLSNPLSESVFDKDKRKERKEGRAHNRAARKTEGTRLRQYLRRLKNRKGKY